MRFPLASALLVQSSSGESVAGYRRITPWLCITEGGSLFSFQLAVDGNIFAVATLMVMSTENEIAIYGFRSAVPMNQPRAVLLGFD